ncbi:MAG: NirD/YgiW/YdeI family stress tolerance protein, partial [Treponema sp.]|nr:NirD/YgiW/YdeI family stress tolerance protein [Treponema sp.]
YGWTGQPVTVVQARTYGHQVPVVIVGTLVQFYSAPDNYVFRDSTGDIIVKIGPKEWEYLWYQGVSISPGDTIEIYGEVHWPRHSWGTPEIHVRFIRKA